MKKVFYTISVFLCLVALSMAETPKAPDVEARASHILADNETLLAGTTESNDDTFTSDAILVGRGKGKVAIWLTVAKRGTPEPVVRVELSPGVSATVFSTDNIPTKLVNLVSGKTHYLEIDAPLVEYLKIVVKNDGPGVAKITLRAFIK